MAKNARGAVRCSRVLYGLPKERGSRLNARRGQPVAKIRQAALGDRLPAPTTMMCTCMVETSPTSEPPIVASEWGSNLGDRCTACAPQPERPGEFEQDAAVIRMTLDDRSIRMLLFVPR